MKALKNRLISCAVVLVFSSLLNPLSSAYATVESPQTISIFSIGGVTPPVGGATPVESITSTNEYTGSVTWSDTSGVLNGTFRDLTIYQVMITLFPEPGFTYATLPTDFFRIEGASNVVFDPELGVILALFYPRLEEGASRLDNSFGDAGSVNIADIFGDSPITQGNSTVNSIHVDRVELDSENRLVVLGSFYSDSADRSAIGAGYRNSLAIAAQSGNESTTSAAVAALSYRGGDRSDWYLPSIDELAALYLEGYEIDRLQPESWSSTESSPDYARTHTIDSSFVAEKGTQKGTTPIRSGMLETPTIGDTGPGGGRIFYETTTAFACGRTLADTCNYLEVAPFGWLEDGIDPLFSWATGPTNHGRTVSIDHHILFRLNPDGSYDNSFGNPELTLRRDTADTPKRYTLITTTSAFYIERADLEIDSVDRTIVMLSGTVPDSYDGDHHNFIARYGSDGLIDQSFGENGAIGSLFVQEEYANELYADIDIDSQDRVVAVSFINSNYVMMSVDRFTSQGLRDENFGADDPGRSLLVIFYPDGLSPTLSRNVQVVADDAGGYLVAFAGGVWLSDDSGDSVFFTQLFRMGEGGTLDEDFHLDTENLLVAPLNVLPYLAFTEILPDGDSGFLISGSYVGIGIDGVAFTTRFLMDGTPDLNFSRINNFELNPLNAQGCFSTALSNFVEGISSERSMYIGLSCWQVGDDSFNVQIKKFSSTGELVGGINVIESMLEGPQNINQIRTSSDGKIIVLRGAKPSTGLTSLNFQLYNPGIEFSEPTISRYQLFEENLGESTPENVVDSIPTPPTSPTPYLRSISPVKISIRDDQLLCSAGTYNAGYILNGINQGSTSSIYSPSTFRYSLYFDEKIQDSFTVSSESATFAWTIPSVISGSLVSCSVTVDANGVTRTYKSTDKDPGISAAKKKREIALAEAAKNYPESLIANEKSFQRGLIENRDKWRIESEKIRTVYRSTQAKMKLANTPSTKASIALELKALSAARKRLLGDYTASKSLATIARESADSQALVDYEKAIREANATYELFIQSSGYGVFAP